LIESTIKAQVTPGTKTPAVKKLMTQRPITCSQNRSLGVLVPAVLLVLFVQSAFSADDQPNKSLHQLFDDSWEFDLHEAPIFATRFGDHRWDDQLSRESLADQERRVAQRRKFHERWQAIDRASLNRADRMNYDIFGRLLEDDLADASFKSYLMPITNRSGFHTSFPELPKDVPLNTTKDHENYIARLKAFSQHTDDHIELMRAGIQQRIVLPAVVLEGYESSLTTHIVDDPTKSLLFAPFQKFPARVAEADRPRLVSDARDAIEKQVIPSYRKFLEFMKTEYVPACRGSISASELPHGRDFYRHRVRMFTTLDLTPEQVHETGQSEVKRIRQEMDGVIKKVEFKGDFAAFVDHLRSEPKFYATEPEQLMKEVALVLKKMDGELPRLFKTLPRTSYGIREIPAYIAPKTTSAYYQQPAGDGTQAGFYYVNTFNLKARPLYEVQALSLHEAVPGHHLQIALQQELTGIPHFRRFAGVTAFIEGWGLYSERLGLEVGFYEDPYSDFGRLTYEMWRACRLVVDTGMHYLGWSREQAIQFMAANTALSLHNITSEVDRYIAWPGQALAYKTGELKIRELRALAERELGERFDVREFHDIVLGSGAIPLSVLENNVREYIAEKNN
jgi:uncharacterized protein (DUF885 family)